MLYFRIAYTVTDKATVFSSIPLIAHCYYISSILIWFQNSYLHKSIMYSICIFTRFFVLAWCCLFSKALYQKTWLSTSYLIYSRLGNVSQIDFASINHTSKLSMSSRLRASSLLWFSFSLFHPPDFRTTCNFFKWTAVVLVTVGIK